MLQKILPLSFFIVLPALARAQTPAPAKEAAAPSKPATSATEAPPPVEAKKPPAEAKKPPAEAQKPPAEAKKPPAAAEKPPAETAPDKSATPAHEVVIETREGMGSKQQIQVYCDDPATARTAIEAAFAEMARIEALMSEWKSDSDVSKINRAAGQEEPIPVALETMTVLSRGKEISTQSAGAFSLTWAALSSLWTFEAPQGDTPPVPEAARAQKKTELVDDGQLFLDATQRTARLGREGMALGLGAIAKGYAIDRALEVLKAKGFNRALIFAGGDIAVMGAKGDRPWLVGIQDPRAVGYFATVPVQDEAIVSSGDYERYFEVGDQRYHHILDPRSGYPAQGVRSVTVLAKDAMTADAVATAVFVLGPKDGMKLVEEQEGVETLIVDAGNNILISSGLRSRVRVLRAPTN